MTRTKAKAPVITKTAVRNTLPTDLEVRATVPPVLVRVVKAPVPALAIRVVKAPVLADPVPAALADRVPEDKPPVPVPVRTGLEGRAPAWERVQGRVRCRTVRRRIGAREEGRALDKVPVRARVMVPVRARVMAPVRARVMAPVRVMAPLKVSPGLAGAIGPTGLAKRSTRRRVPRSSTAGPSGSSSSCSMFLRPSGKARWSSIFIDVSAGRGVTGGR